MEFQRAAKEAKLKNMQFPNLKNEITKITTVLPLIKHFAACWVTYYQEFS